jgi:hypothetical protein
MPEGDWINLALYSGMWRVLLNVEMTPLFAYSPGNSLTGWLRNYLCLNDAAP